MVEKTVKHQDFVGQCEPVEETEIARKYWETPISIEALEEEFGLKKHLVYKNTGQGFLKNARCKHCSNMLTADNRTDAMRIINKVLNKKRPASCLPCAKERPFKALGSSSRQSAPKQKYRTPENKQEFYDSWEWTKLRYSVMLKYGKSCMVCGMEPGDTRVGGDKVKICVDHIKPLSKNWDLRLEESNLQILCMECNKGKGAWDETDHRPK